MDKKRFAFFGIFLCFVVLLSFGTNFIYSSWLESEPTMEQKRQELAVLLRDGNPDRTLFESGWMNTDFAEEISPYLRFVRAQVTISFPEAEARELLSAFARADLGLGEEDSLPKEIKDEIDQAVREALLPDGTVVVPFDEVVAQATLTQNAVISSTLLVRSLGQQVQSADTENVYITVTVLPNSDFDDNWMAEVVFDGTAKEFMNSNAVYADFENGFIVFQRPSDKLFLEPDGYPYTEGSRSEVRTQDAIIYMKGIAGYLAPSRGEMLHLLEQEGFAFVSGTFGPSDMGAPVFYIKDGEPYWMGILVDIDQSGTTGVVLLREKLQSRIPPRLGP